MSLLTDIYTLTIKGAQYACRMDAVRELPHAMHDMILGNTLAPKSDGRIYTDLHAHIPIDLSMEKFIPEVAKRVDVVALVTRTVGENAGHMSLDDAVDKMKREGIPFTAVGPRLVKVDVAGKPLYLVRATEVYVKENQGIVMVGNTQEFEHHKLLFSEGVSAAKKMGAPYFLDHTMSVPCPVIAFRYPNARELEIKSRWFEEYSPVIETHNHQNTLWMFPSNVAAKRIAEDYDLVGLANSDTHFDHEEVGLSRTSLPVGMLDFSTEERFFASLDGALKSRHKAEIQLDCGYASVWRFGKNMFGPVAKRLLSGKGAHIAKPEA